MTMIALNNQALLSPDTVPYASHLEPQLVPAVNPRSRQYCHHSLFKKKTVALRDWFALFTSASLRGWVVFPVPWAKPQLRAFLLFQECQLSAKSGAPALKGPGVGVVLPGHLCPRSRCSSSELSLSSTCSEYSSGSSCTWHDGKNLRRRVRPPFKAHHRQSEPGNNLLEAGGRWAGGLRRKWPVHLLLEKTM